MDDQNDFGFIMTRHVRSDSHAKLWIECYNSIRKFYNNVIMIIDDNSDQEILDRYIVPTTNVYKINTKFKKSGEMLPYYYFYYFKPFKKAIILNDSMFIQKSFTDKINNVSDVKFLWHFPEAAFDSNLFFNLNNFENLITNKYNFQGCFASTCVITWDFLNTLQQQYNFLNLVNFIKTRPQRMDLERLFAILCITELKKKGEYNPNQISLFGSIFNHVSAFGLDFGGYKNGRASNQFVVKVWNGR